MSTSSTSTTSVIQLGAESDAPLKIDASSSHPSLLAVGRLVGRRLRVTVSDGRVLSGILACLDPQGNLVLSDTLTLAEGKKEVAKGEEDEEGTTAAAAAAAASTSSSSPSPLSLDDGHHHSHPQQHHNQQQQQQSQQQDHAMGVVIVPRSRRVAVSVEVEAFEEERVRAEVERATTKG